MLWDIIRDWFVQYVFGGITSEGNVFGGVIASVFVNEPAVGDLPAIEEYQPIYGDEFFLNIGNYQVSIADWLSTTATIVVLVALALFLFFVVRYLFRLTSGLIRGR